ncbi:hypothetical protein [Agaribacter flavus]|uniref:Nitrate/nitrite sensing protein domain-containing protein n=1 Tax=Agaribacter flavus TaxID=1902781 RepID=A0ABV7FKW1_9ALTE
MSVFLAILLSILLVLVALIVSGIRNEKGNKKRQRVGIKWIQELVSLLSLVQQHRGLTSGYIGGDNSLMPRILKLQDDIESIQQNINKNFIWIRSNGFWVGKMDHWLRLKTINRDKTKTYNFNQHNAFIRNLLHLIEDCAEQHHLQEMKCLNNTPANILWQLLLNASESVGQARAIGTGIAASGCSSSVERIKLHFLQEQLEQFLVRNPMPELAPPIEALLTCIESQILIEKPSLNASQYFDLATNALNKIMDGFKLQITKLNA